MGQRVLLGLALLAACDGADPGADARLVGSQGTDDGRFYRPRGIAAAPDGTLYVVDKTGRIQAFDAAGAFARTWSPPDVSNGQPIDLTVGPDGRLYVCDTHQYRILVYEPDGTLVRQWGREGHGPGEFVYPVGIAFAPNGELFVAEYGGNDRIQVFTADGDFVRQFGGYGDAPGQFKRPQDLAIAGDRVYVLDSVNHEVDVFTTDGAFVASWGRGGRGPGEFSYPYGIGVLVGGDLLIVEYGNHRVQRFRPDGTFVKSVGTVGGAPGQLYAPWDVEILGDVVIVADTQNHRIQYWPVALF